MKKPIKVASILLLSLTVLGIGYFIGHSIGRTFGAQQYTKKLWATNEMQLSSDKITEKINTYRSENGLEPFQETASLCTLAAFRAEEAREKFGGKWDIATQSYVGVENPNALHETDLTEETIQELCPGCVSETLSENAYISLRPETCLNLANKQFCSGGEEFGVLEKYTDRVVNGWIQSPAHNQVLLSGAKFGCVGVFGGTVILKVGEIQEKP